MKPELKIKIENDNAETTAILSGDLTVRYAKELKAAFQKFESKNITTLHVAMPQAIDLVFVQLFWAYRKQIEKRGKKINVSCSLAEADESLFQRTGFSSLLQSNNSNLIIN